MAVVAIVLLVVMVVVVVAVVEEADKIVERTGGEEQLLCYLYKKKETFNFWATKSTRACGRGEEAKECLLPSQRIGGADERRRV